MAASEGDVGVAVTEWHVDEGQMDANQIEPMAFRHLPMQHNAQPLPYEVTSSEWLHCSFSAASKQTSHLISPPALAEVALGRTRSAQSGKISWTNEARMCETLARWRSRFAQSGEGEAKEANCGAGRAGGGGCGCGCEFVCCSGCCCMFPCFHVFMLGAAERAITKEYHGAADGDWGCVVLGDKWRRVVGRHRPTSVGW